MTSTTRRKDGSTRDQRAAEVRGQILEAGRRWFGRKGLYETLVGEIAADAGIAKGTFYLYFKDKEDLILAVAQSAFEELGDTLTRATNGGRPWDERLLSIAEVHVQFFAAQPDRMRILHQLRGMLTFERPEWLPLRVCIDAHLDLLARLLLTPPRPKGLTHRRATEIGGLLFGAVSGAVSVWASTHGDRGLQALPPGIPRAVRDFASALAAEMSDVSAPSASRTKAAGTQRSRRKLSRHASRG